MKLLKWYSILILAGFFFMTGLASASTEDESLISLMDKISQRRNSYPENKNYQVKVLEKSIEMNKKWEPKKTIITKAMVKLTNGEEDIEILEATETEEGITTDVTEKIIEKLEKQKEKARADDENKALEKEAENPLDVFFPFDETKRSEFDFRRLDDGVIDEKDVFVIESVAKTKDENHFEGRYYIDQNTLDILKIDVKPTDTPFIVKEMEMEMDFEVLPEGNFVMKKMKAKAVVKMVIKTIRHISETEYFDYEILHPSAR